MNIARKDADDLLRVFAETIAHPTSNEYTHGGEPWLMLSARSTRRSSQRDGLRKADVKRGAVGGDRKCTASRMAARDFDARAARARRTELGEIAPGHAAADLADAEGIGIVVAGGPGTHSVYVPSFGNTRAVTRRMTR